MRARSRLTRAGRPPVPKALRALHGDTNHEAKATRDAIAAAEPQGRGDLWEPPPHFDDEQRAVWHYALEHAPFGLLTGTDRGTLAIYCAAYVEHARAVAKCNEFGSVLLKKGELRKNPYLAVVERQALLMLRAGTEMGFTPSSRAIIGRASALAGSGGFPNGAPKQIEGDLESYLARKPN